MAKHKWHKEIKAWADGAEIEGRWQDDTQMWSDWGKVEFISLFGENDWEFRIKPQPKKPQYLYVYKEIKSTKICLSDCQLNSMFNLLGKIKLEEEA